MAESGTPRDWSAHLQTETERWVKSGIIGADQRDSILSLYPKSESSGRDRTIMILTLLGSLLVGAGVILFFAANWPRLSATVKVGAIIAAITGAYWAGYHLSYVRDYPRLGYSLILLGALFYGAGIWLVAQIFHLDTHYPNGYLMWGLGVLPLVVATRSVWVLCLATVALDIWTLSEQSLSLTYNPLFIAVAGLIFYLSRRLKSTLAESGIVLGLLFWFVANVLTHADAQMMYQEPLLLARLLIVYGAVVVAAAMAGLGDQRAYLGLGSIIALAGTYLLTFRFNYSSQLLGPLIGGSTFQTTGVILLIAALGAIIWWARRQHSSSLQPLLLTSAILVASAISAQWLAPIHRMVLFNLLLFGGTVGLIVLGIQRRIQLVINLGLLVFMVHMLTRYFDLFFSAMDRSLFFVLGGLLLLGGGWLLERNRRRWMANWGGDANDQ